MSICRIVAVSVILLYAAPVALAQPAVKASLVGETTARLAQPHDGAFSPDGERLYVTDMANSQVRVFDADSLRLLETFGRDELSRPHDLEFDRQGRLLVADTGNGRIAIYAVGGAKPALVGELTGLVNPEGVAVGADGRVYATNTGAGSVSVFRGGRLERTVGEHGSGPGQFVRPHDIEFGADGRVYVVDSGNHRVQVLDAELGHLATSAPALGLKEPKYLAFDGERIWLADEYNHRILLLDRGLRAMGVLGSGKRGRSATEFYKPEAVLARSPYVWVIDTYNDRIVRLRVSP
jgi:DNA-binding beta-propeller fold protein YncE